MTGSRTPMSAREPSELKRTLSADGLFAIVTTEFRDGRSRPVRQSVQSADGQKVVFAPDWGDFEFLPDGRLAYTVSLRQGGTRAAPYRFYIDAARSAFCAGSGDADWRPLPQLTTMLAHDHAQPWRIDLTSPRGKGGTLAALLVFGACLAAAIRFAPEDAESPLHVFLLGLAVLMVGFSAWATWNAWRPR